MSNLAAAFQGAAQGLDQMAGMQGQREMQEAMAMRAENLAYLNNALTTRRQVMMTDMRTSALEDRDQKRIAAESQARRGDIQLQENLRNSNRSRAQQQQLIDTEKAQDNAFTNQGELQARAAGRTARVQTARDAVVQANQARQQKATIREWLSKYSAQAHGSHDPRGTMTTDPMTVRQLVQFAQYDPVLKAQLKAYKDADASEQAATRAMGRFPSQYDTPSTPGAVAPANDPLTSPPISNRLIPYSDNEGPGVSDQPYPSPSGADEIGLSDSTSAGGTGDDDDGDGSGY